VRPFTINLRVVIIENVRHLKLNERVVILRRSNDRAALARDLNAG
jgi:hypothetical protein